jgi:predicted site-specific integrase-resolvase
VCHARVSSSKQEKDLERQIQLLGEANPYHEIVKDVPDINWRRSGFTYLLERDMRGGVKETVVPHKDWPLRLAVAVRRGISHIGHAFERSGCALVVHDENPRGNADVEHRDTLLANVTSNNERRTAACRRERRDTVVREQEEEGEEEERGESATAEEAEDGGRAEETGRDQMREVSDIPRRKPASNIETVDGRDEVGVQPGGGKTQREGAGVEGVAGVASGMGRDGGRGVDKAESGRRRDAGTIPRHPVRDTGLAHQRHCRSLRSAPEQGEGGETEAQVSATKRRRGVDHSPDETAQLQNGPGECVAVVVRDGEG